MLNHERCHGACKGCITISDALEYEADVKHELSLIQRNKLSIANQITVREMCNMLMQYSKANNSKHQYEQNWHKVRVYKKFFGLYTTINRIKHFFNIDTDYYIKGLCCGDCANVAKKCEYLNITDFKTISKMLQEEVDLKKIPELKKNTIGF